MAGLVRLLERVVAQVVELLLAVVVLDVHVPAGADRRVLGPRAAGVDLREDAAVRRPVPRSTEQWPQAPAVLHTAYVRSGAGLGATGVVEDGRRDVLVRHHLARGMRRGRHPLIGGGHPYRVG